MEILFNVGTKKLAVTLLPENDRVVWHERNQGFEPETRRVFVQAVRPGSIVLDVGAYTGLYTIAAEKLGAQAWAIEPVAVNMKRLQQNCRRNDVLPVMIEAAASDTRRTALLARPNRGTSPLPSAARIDTQVGDISLGRVRTIVLDDLQLNNISLVKIDVERHEEKVLIGLCQTLLRCRPVVIVELLDNTIRGMIQTLLPNHRQTAVMDGVNFLFEPEGTSIR